MAQDARIAGMIATRLDRSPLRPVHWTVFTILGLAILFDGYDMQAMAFVAPALRADWGLSAAALGPMLSAALVGMAIGTWLGGSAGDRWGHRTTLLASVLAFALFALASGFASSTEILALLRFATGVGLGAAVPNATALISEWSPRRYRGFAVTFIIVAVPIGGMLGAALSSWIVPEFGWRTALIAGGALPLLVCLVMALFLPESPAFLARRHGKKAAGLLLDRHSIPAVRSDTDHAPSTIEPLEDPHVGVTPLSPQFRRTTIGLWLAFLASMYVLYSYLSWLPVLLTMNGVELASAIRGSLYFNLFGVIGSFVGTWAVARSGSRRTLTLAGVLAMLATAAIAMVVSGGAAEGYGATMIAVGLIGATVLTIQVTLYALAAEIYPAACRSRGIGWAASVGRLGAILSAATGGALLESAAGETLYFVVIAIALAVLVAATFIIDRHAAPQGGVAMRQGNP